MNGCWGYLVTGNSLLSERSVKRFAQCNKISRVGLHNKKSAAEKNMGKMMKMRRRNCYVDVITKAEGETDRPHYGSCINVNQLLLTFSFFLLSLNKKDGPRDFLAERCTVFRVS
jgi:hypothetical protein